MVHCIVTEDDHDHDHDEDHKDKGDVRLKVYKYILCCANLNNRFVELSRISKSRRINYFRLIFEIESF